MKIAILSAILGNFDSPVDPVPQDLPEGVEVTFHRFTDTDFPPITGLTPRFQYRIPKMFGWQMFPGYDVYIWLDGSMSLTRPDSVKWLLEQLGNTDIAFFKHPWRKTVKEEVDHIEQKLQEGNKYITSRYKNGLHREQLNEFTLNDDTLYASTAFIYQYNFKSSTLLQNWWLFQSRYYTCDQVNLPFAIEKTKRDLRFYADELKPLTVKKIDEDIFKIPYISLVSKHK